LILLNDLSPNNVCSRGYERFEVLLIEEFEDLAEC
jgi:hypothetical protein